MDKKTAAEKALEILEQLEKENFSVFEIDHIIAIAKVINDTEMF